tara:strand:+ start:992 stop:1705 length:714 start_codon:yes stop_codon:yes gene_type:complete
MFCKSGCSTLRYLFTHLHFEEFNDIRFIYNAKKYGLNHVNTWTPYEYSHNINNHCNKEFIIPDKFKHYKCICVVRNSYSRILSAYFNQWLELNIEQGPCRIRRGDTFIEFLNKIETLDNIHYYPQKINKNNRIDKYIYLSNIKELYTVYKDIIKLPEEKLKIVYHILIDKNIKKECMKKKSYIENKCFANYNFLMDTEKLCITSKGVPHYLNMYNKQAIEIVLKKFEDEINIFNFKL